MIPAAFDYVRAGSAEEAISLIGEHGDEAKFLAGGHSLLPLMKLRLAQPTRARRHRPAVATCRTSATPATTSPSARSPGTATSRRSDLLAEHVPLLRPRGEPRRRPAGAPPRHDRRLDRPRRPGVRPAGDDAGARRDVRRPGTERHARDRRRRLLRGLPRRRRWPPTSCSPRSACRRCTGAGWGFQKFNRRAQDWAIVGVAAWRRNGDAGVGLVNMGSTPILATSVASALAGGASVADAAEQAAAEADPQADLNASVEYRAHLAKVLTRRALEAGAAA